MNTIPKEYEDCCTKVMDCLYVGDKKCAKSKSLLEKVGITHVCNCTVPRNQGGVHNFFETDERFHYLRCPCVDSNVEDMSIHFRRCIDFIHTARSKGNCVLVHCQMGQSRSVTIILAYMITLKSWDLKSAYTHLKTIRPKVKPKANFLRQLIKFQTEWNKEQEELKNNEDEDDDIKYTLKKQQTKKRKLSDGNGDDSPPSKKVKTLNDASDRVFGVALPPHLTNQT